MAICFNNHCPQYDGSESGCKIHCNHFVDLCDMYKSGMILKEIEILVNNGFVLTIDRYGVMVNGDYVEGNTVQEQIAVLTERLVP